MHYYRTKIEWAKLAYLSAVAVYYAIVYIVNILYGTDDLVF